MNKHAVGIRELAEWLEDAPPKGRTFPDQPYTLHLYFDSVESWQAAVDQYGAVIDWANEDGDGHYSATRKFGDTDPTPYAFAGAELHISHVADDAA